MHVAVHRYQTLRALLVERVLLHEVNQDVLGFVHLAFSLVEDSKQAHNFDGLRVLEADHLQEELRPLHLLQLARREEALLNDVEV